MCEGEDSDIVGAQSGAGSGRRRRARSLRGGSDPALGRGSVARSGPQRAFAHSLRNLRRSDQRVHHGRLRRRARAPRTPDGPLLDEVAHRGHPAARTERLHGHDAPRAGFRPPEGPDRSHPERSLRCRRAQPPIVGSHSLLPHRRAPGERPSRSGIGLDDPALFRSHGGFSRARPWRAVALAIGPDDCCPRRITAR